MALAIKNKIQKAGSYVVDKAELITSAGVKENLIGAFVHIQFYEDIEDEWKGLELCIKCSNFDTVQCCIYPNMGPDMFGRRKKCCNGTKPGPNNQKEPRKENSSSNGSGAC